MCDVPTRSRYQFHYLERVWYAQVKGMASWQCCSVGKERWERAGSPDLCCMGGGKDAGVPLANPHAARAHPRQWLGGQRGSPSCMAQPSWDALEPMVSP